MFRVLQGFLIVSAAVVAVTLGFSQAPRKATLSFERSFGLDSNWQQQFELEAGQAFEIQVASSVLPRWRRMAALR